MRQRGAINSQQLKRKEVLKFRNWAQAKVTEWKISHKTPHLEEMSEGENIIRGRFPPDSSRLRLPLSMYFPKQLMQGHLIWKVMWTEMEGWEISSGMRWVGDWNLAIPKSNCPPYMVFCDLESSSQNEGRFPSIGNHCPVAKGWIHLWSFLCRPTSDICILTENSLRMSSQRLANIW